MEEAGPSEEPQGLFGRFLRLTALLGGWVLMALMVYTVADVVLRYLFNRPFSGSLEVTEFAMSAIVFLGIAYCGWVGGHVAVDILERPLENPRLRFLPVILTFVSARAVRGDRLADRRRGARHHDARQQHDALAALAVPVHRGVRLGDVRHRAASSRAIRLLFKKPKDQHDVAQ